jgi:hypothetical protein
MLDTLAQEPGYRDQNLLLTSDFKNPAIYATGDFQRVDSKRFSGVLAPVITPFKADLDPDAGKLAGHCRWLLSQGVSLAVFGTNSEANSLSLQEKIFLLEQLVAAGVPAQEMMPGTGCCALPACPESGMPRCAYVATVLLQSCQ